ncbi:MAG: hypothetical protein ACXV5N_12110 [Halobacteriota archaeon]
MDAETVSRVRDYQPCARASHATGVTTSCRASVAETSDEVRRPPENCYRPITSDGWKEVYRHSP